MPSSLPHPDWLFHELDVTGPDAAAFGAAAAGAGVVPWVFDYGRMEEDWFHRLVAARMAVVGARVLARQVREAVWQRHEAAISRVGVSRACPFDLHVLVPVPRGVLAWGPEDPRARAWLWENWGTTWGLRRVEVAGLGEGLRYRFWSADWTPWRALARVASAWPGLRFAVRPAY